MKTVQNRKYHNLFCLIYHCLFVFLLKFIKLLQRTNCKNTFFKFVKFLYKKTAQTILFYILFILLYLFFFLNSNGKKIYVTLIKSPFFKFSYK